MKYRVTVRSERASQREHHAIITDNTGGCNNYIINSITSQTCLQKENFESNRPPPIEMTV